MAEDAAKSADDADSATAEPPADAVPANSVPTKPGPAPVAADTPLLSIDSVVKKFGALRAVDGLSLDIKIGRAHV